MSMDDGCRRLNEGLANMRLGIERGPGRDSLAPGPRGVRLGGWGVGYAAEGNLCDSWRHQGRDNSLSTEMIIADMLRVGT
jgi:hypothetical protein